MDAGIIKSFKSQYQRRFVKLALDRSDNGHPRPYKLNQLEVMHMATAAWSDVSATTIRNCWRHTGISLPYAPELAGPLVYYPKIDTASAVADTAPEFGLAPERIDSGVYDMLETLMLDHPTEEDLTVQQIVQEMNSNPPYFY